MISNLRIWQHWRTPGIKTEVRPYGKTKGSLTKVPVARALAEELVEWREQLKKEDKDTSPDAFMFRGRFGGPMDSSNFRHRVLHKLAEEQRLPKLTFQVIRRTIATLGKTKGHVKDIQGIMRHTTASTTTDVYMQSLEPEVRTAINSIYDELVGNGTTGPFLPDQQQYRPAFGPKTETPLLLRRRKLQHRSRFLSRNVRRRPRRSRFLVWFWNLRQVCDKVAEGMCF